MLIKLYSCVKLYDEFFNISHHHFYNVKIQRCKNIAYHNIMFTTDIKVLGTCRMYLFRFNSLNMII